jgi:hypothetical protein
VPGLEHFSFDLAVKITGKEISFAVLQPMLMAVRQTSR